MQDLTLIGAGKMAIAYAKVLEAQGVSYNVFGRGEESAQAFTEATAQTVETGGLQQILSRTPKSLAPTAIVALPVVELAPACTQLIKAGVKRILVEKPAGLNIAELEALNRLAGQNEVDVRVALNRRFLAAVLEARRRADDDGGITSFTFEFTEWAQAIAKTKHPQIVKNNWFLANSLHVVDLAFFLGGTPTELFSTSGGSLEWHPRASRFSGAGRTQSGAVFSYHADWAAPGRWGVEILTSAYRYILRPMEELRVQKLNTVAIETLEIDDSLDQNFKPGLYRMVEAFLQCAECSALPTIGEHTANAQNIYSVMLPENPAACSQGRLAEL